MNHIAPLYPSYQLNEAILSSDTSQALTSIVVLCYNGLEHTTIPCLESILANTTAGAYELIVVDNASSDGTPEYLTSLSQGHPHIRLQLNDTNRGYAGGNNDGIRLASGNCIILLNNDTLVPHGWLDPLLHILDTQPQIGLVSPVTNSAGNEQRIDLPLLNETNFEQLADRYILAQQGHWFTTSKLGFFCVAMRRSLIDEVGLLDEKFGIGMFEDDDFCVRVMEKGYRLAVAECCFVYHKGSASFKKLNAADLAETFQNNRDYFYQKHAKYWVFSDIATAIWRKINDDLELYLIRKDVAALERISARRTNLSDALMQLKEVELASGTVGDESLNKIQLAEKHKQLMEMSDWSVGLKRANEQLTAELATKNDQLKAARAYLNSPLHRLIKWIKKRK